jgi:hypothetical protein
MAASILFLLPVMALTAIPAHAESVACAVHRPAPQAQAVSEFTTTVNLYMELHWLLERPLASLTRWSDPQQATRAREAHRKAIVEARIATPRGDIFTPRVAAYLRNEIMMAVRRGQTEGIDVEEAALEALPELPIELEYRFIDRDLVLLDMEIDTIVDVLYEALPPESIINWAEMCSGS